MMVFTYLLDYDFIDKQPCLLPGGAVPRRNNSHVPRFHLDESSFSILQLLADLFDQWLPVSRWNRNVERPHGFELRPIGGYQVFD